MFSFYLRACARVVPIVGALLIVTAYAVPNPAFAAPTLSPRTLVREVLRQNQGIAAMQAAVEVAKSQIESAGALDDPRLSYIMAPNTFGYPGQGLNQSLQISQTFPWPGTLDLRADAASAEARSVAQQLVDLRLQLAARARAVYADWYYVHRALAVNDENQALAQRLRKVAEASYASGRASQQDVLQADIELTRLRNQTLELERRRRSVRAKINALLNRSPHAPLPPPSDLPLPRHLPAIATLRTRALDRYPALKSLDAQIAAGRARLNAAEKDAWPSFKVMAGYNSLWDAPQKRLVVGISINIPFGGNHEGKIDAARARLHQSQAKLTDARAQLLSSLEQAYATAEQAAHTIRLYVDKLLPLARQNLKAAENDYRNDRGDFLTLVTAEREYLMAQLERARARANFFTQLAFLNYQTGGTLFPDAPDALVRSPLPRANQRNRFGGMKTDVTQRFGRQP